MQLYLRLGTFPEVPAMLRELKQRGIKLAILSNGSPPMLAALTRNLGLEHVFDAVLSVEEVGVFKPHPSVYGLAAQRLDLAPERICFLSSNGWDAFSAKAFGFRVLWCNRYGQPPERIPATPDGEISDLAALPGLLAG
jgi:2-haloacid dehalogenase